MAEPAARGELRAIRRDLERSAGPNAVEEGTTWLPQQEAQVQQIRQALLEDAQDTRDADGPARQEIPGAGGLLHRGVPLLLFGERGCGKSTVVLAAGMSAATTGEGVLYLDRENGAALAGERIDALLEAHPDWGDPLENGRFAGRHYPELSGSWNPEAFGEAVMGAGYSVVIYDSFREMLAQLGLDPDKERDISTFLRLAVTPLVRRGGCVVVLDNVGHENTHRPKGSASKLDALPQAAQGHGDATILGD